MITIDNTPELGQIMHRGKALGKNIQQRVLAADLELSVDQVTELTFTLDDPSFEILESGIFDLNTTITYRGLHLYVAVIETNEGGGLGGLSIRCRPQAVKSLRQLRGKEVMRHVTPATYLRSECRKAKIKEPVAQQTKKKKKIARDLDQDKTSYAPSARPSAWTTIQRLANEDGCYVYEIGDTIFYGKPTWLVEQRSPTRVEWYPEGGKEPMGIPEIRHSEDSRDIEVDVTLPIRRAGRVLPGTGLELDGFPKYSDMYFINSVSYPLVGDGEVSISASTIRNPEPQKASSVTGTTEPVTGDGRTASGAKEIARAMLSKYGWSEDQFPALEELWTRESGWDYKAENSSSGAYGIPQALPASKMATAGSDWRTNPTTQIKWGLGYIKGRYGSPNAAWRFWQSRHWY